MKPRLEPVMVKHEELLLQEMDKAVTELNGAAKPSQDLIISPAPKELTAFIPISERLADSLVKAAQVNLDAAQAAFAEAQTYATNVREECERRAKELAETNERLRQFSARLLDAHKEYMGEK